MCGPSSVSVHDVLFHFRKERHRGNSRGRKRKLLSRKGKNPLVSSYASKSCQVTSSHVKSRGIEMPVNHVESLKSLTVLLRFKLEWVFQIFPLRGFIPVKLIRLQVRTPAESYEPREFGTWVQLRLKLRLEVESDLKSHHGLYSHHKLKCSMLPLYHFCAY